METFLTAVWQKLNKPLHYLLVAAALWEFGPNEYRWISYIIAAFGLAGATEWAAKQIRLLLERRALRVRAGKIIGRLNSEEKIALLPAVEKGEQSFYFNWRDYHGAWASIDAGDEYSRLVGVYNGLCTKGILASVSEDVITTLHITDPAWSVLMELKRRGGNYLRLPVPGTE